MSQVDTRRDDLPRPAGLGSLAGFLVLTLAVGFTAGAVTAPKIATWYQTIRKPDFNPPNWLFGPVWTVLYVAMAYSAWRIWRLPPSRERTQGLTLFGIQLTFNGLWSPAFFSLESPLAGMIMIVPLWLSVVATGIRFWTLDRISGALFIPYVAWVSFAGFLNATILKLNPPA